MIYYLPGLYPGVAGAFPRFATLELGFTTLEHTERQKQDRKGREGGEREILYTQKQDRKGREGERERYSTRGT